MLKKDHIPVLLKKMLFFINASKSGIYVDATFGAGGYSRAILESNKENKVIAFDRDENVKKYVIELEKDFKDRFVFIRDKFSSIANNLKKINISKIDGLVMDLGVSSMQIDNANRGFSFMHDAPLDMRMGINDISAYEVVNNFPEEKLANIIYQYGEERKSRRIASLICKTRQIRNIKTTLELSEIIVKAKGKINFKDKIHPATKTFQAIRIYVNEELEEIKKTLSQIKDLLRIHGRLVIVSFHGLEDKIVKNFIREESGRNAKLNRYLPSSTEKVVKDATLVSLSKAVKVDNEELNTNYRSRSAILRAAERI